jgi:site-specific recombinase XerD
MEIIRLTSNFEKLVEGFVQECKSRGVSEGTIRTRERFLLNWGVWLRTSGCGTPIEEVNAEVIQKFLKGRSIFKATATVAGEISQLRCFGDYLNRQGIWPLSGWVVDLISRDERFSSRFLVILRKD